MCLFLVLVARKIEKEKCFWKNIGYHSLYLYKKCWFHWVVIFINFQEIIKKDDKIIEIKLSRYFYTDEEFKNLENKGFLVSWMEDNIKNEEEIFDIIVPE